MKRHIKKGLLIAGILASVLSLAGCPKEAGEGNGGGSGATTYPTSWASISANDPLIGTWELSYSGDLNANIHYESLYRMTISSNRIEFYYKDITTNSSTGNVTVTEDKAFGTDVACIRYSPTPGYLVFYTNKYDDYYFGIAQGDSNRLNKYVDTSFIFEDENTIKVLSFGKYGSNTYYSTKSSACETITLSGWIPYSDSNCTTFTRKTN